MTEPLRFVFPLTGGMHQALHLLPVAAALDDRGHAARVLTMDGATTAFVREVLATHPGHRIALDQLAAAVVERGLARATRRDEPFKGVRILENRAKFRDADALIVAERTTSLLRRLRLFDGPIVHIPHGAGDRAVGYERRIARYDLHLVAGEKDRTRFIAAGLAPPDRVVACGYVKFAGVRRLRPDPPRLFANDRPVVLYNPHFDRTLGSFDAVGPALLGAFAARPDLNFVVAPHVKLAKRLSQYARAAIADAVATNILVDLGSDRSCDMSYTRAADIYLGDVSSQVYEYAASPGPAVFIDTTGADWRADPHFAMWRMGEVVPARIPAIMAALDDAPRRQSSYAAAQAELVAGAIGPSWEDAPACAADAIEAFMRARRTTVALGQRSATP